MFQEKPELSKEIEEYWLRLSI